MTPESLVQLIGPTLGLVVTVVGGTIIATRSNTTRIQNLEQQQKNQKDLPTTVAGLNGEFRGHLKISDEGRKRNDEDHTELKREARSTRDLLASEIREMRREIRDEIRRANGDLSGD